MAERKDSRCSTVPNDQENRVPSTVRRIKKSEGSKSERSSVDSSDRDEAENRVNKSGKSSGEERPAKSTKKSKSTVIVPGERDRQLFAKSDCFDAELVDPLISSLSRSLVDRNRKDDQPSIASPPFRTLHVPERCKSCRGVRVTSLAMLLDHAASRHVRCEGTTFGCLACGRDFKYLYVAAAHFLSCEG